MILMTDILLGTQGGGEGLGTSYGNEDVRAGYDTPPSGELSGHRGSKGRNGCHGLGCIQCLACSWPVDITQVRACTLLDTTGTPDGGRRGGGSRPATVDSDDDMPMPGRLEALASARSNSAGSSSRHSRPGSAVINLRGSRPNSAAIAQEIEGFEDDFMVGRMWPSRPGTSCPKHSSQDCPQTEDLRGGHSQFLAHEPLWY